MKALRLLVIAAACLLAGTPAGLRAADAADIEATGERIVSFDSVATLAGNGSLAVAETIIYDFGAHERHGIYRDIPYVSTGPDGKRYRLDIDVTSVTFDGRPAETDQDNDNGNVRIQIGDPDQTINGRHTYVVRYQIDRIVLPEGGGRLLFNVTGNAWQVPIEAASFRVAGVGAASGRCFAGATGSITADCVVEAADGTLSARTVAGLASGEGLTVDANLPAGLTTGYLSPYTPALSTPVGLGLLGLSAVALVGGWIGLVTIWIRDRRRRLGRTVVAQYDAPAGYKPADMGFLIDEQTGRPEVAATLIDLAIRGYLVITPVAKTGLFGHDDFKLTLKQPARLDELDEVERGLLDGIMNGETEIKLRDVDKAKSSAAVGKLYDQIARRLASRGMYDRALKASERAVPVVLMAVATVAPVIAAGIVTAETPSPTTALVVLGVAAVIAGGLAWLALTLLRRQPRLSAAGVEELAYLRGLKLYLGVAEKDRLNFTDAPDKTPERFNKLLPFAIALGVERQWAEQFKGIDVAPAVGGWYAGDPGLLTAAYLATSLNGFSSGVQNSIAAPSSGGSGGGFSGGGFGGGGGGSW